MNTQQFSDTIENLRDAHALINIAHHSISKISNGNEMVVDTLDKLAEYARKIDYLTDRFGQCFSDFDEELSL